MTRRPALVERYLATVGDTCTEHPSFDAACGWARNELMLGRRPVVIERWGLDAPVEVFTMDRHGDVERMGT